MEHPKAAFLRMFEGESLCLGVVGLISVGCKNLKLAQHELFTRMQSFSPFGSAQLSVVELTHAVRLGSLLEVGLQCSLEVGQALELQAIAHLVTDVLGRNVVIVWPGCRSIISTRRSSEGDRATYEAQTERPVKGSSLKHT